MWRWVVLLYLLTVVLSGGTTLLWLWYALVWVWWLAPVPFSILFIAFPALMVVGIFLGRSGVSSPRDAIMPDKRRRNPQAPRNPVPLAVEPVVESEQEPEVEEKPAAVEPVDLDKLFDKPHHTVQRKPKQPKIWGIDP